MADQKVSDLPSLNGADVDPADLLYIVDSSAGTAGSKKITVGQFQIAPFSGSTADTVLYLNGSKVLSSSSALTFDGTNFATTGTATATKFIPTGNVTAGNGMYLPAANNLAWSINGSEQMRLTSTGLGIGTSSPGARLHVAADSVDGTQARVTGATNNNYQLRLGFDTTNLLGKIQAIHVGTAYKDLVLQPDGGNLGLGVTPSAWGGSITQVLQLKNGAHFAGAANSFAQVGANSYFDGTNYKYVGSSFASRYLQNDGTHAWYTAPSGTAGNAISFTQALTLDASGNLGVGITSPSVRLDVSGSIKATSYIGFDLGTANTSGMYTVSTNVIGFTTNATERARITSGGYFKASPAGTYGNSGSFHELRTNASARTVYISNTDATTPLGILVGYTGAAPNGTGSAFLDCEDTAGQRAAIRSNGGLANYSANDVNLSDRREKTNFAPAKSYLDTICAIPVQTFEYIDQSPDDPGLTLGVVAQDVQAVAPELVMESNWGTEDDPKMRLSIYQTDLQYALMKCIQEQQALITALTARVQALEAQP